MPGMLEGKIVLVTGAARGIGRGSAMLFAHEGAQIAVADISIKGVEETAELIAKADGKAIAIGADVSEHEQAI
jgi:NAD(P)-dependent dehydrogenase (short-subunit alcohol dehydrogenase family)